MSKPVESQPAKSGMMQYVTSVDVPVLDSRANSALRVKLLAELDSLLQVAIELKKRINSCAPFLQLPKELICEIANALSDIWPPHSPHCTFTTSKHAALGWITLSHVCHIARDILLEHHTLWAQHLSSLPKACPELIHRLGNVPLTLSFPVRDCSHTADCVEAMMKCTLRARSIDVDDRLFMDCFLDVDKWPVDPAWFSRRELPLLEKLHLAFDISKPKLESITEDVYELPSMLTPRLRELILAHFYIPFDPSTLIDLALVNESDMTLPSPAQFLDLLHRCSALQNLRLCGWVPRSLMPITLPTISLPSLANIDIKDRPDQFLALWSHLIIPSAASRRVAIFSFSSDLSPEAQYDVLRKSLMQNFNLAIDSLAVDQDDDNAVRLTFMQHSSDDILPPNGFRTESGLFKEHFKVVLELSYDNEALCVHHAFKFCSQFIDCTRLQYLDLTNSGGLEGNWAFAVEEWEVMLNSFTGVHTLRLDKRITHCYLLCKALTSYPPKPLLLPSLRCLWIGYLQLAETFRRSDFLEFVISRRRREKGLERLQIDKISGIMDYEVWNVLLPRLCAHVPHVECGLDGSIADEGWYDEEAAAS